MALNTKIFVGSLPPGVKPQELRRLFENYGVVTECDVMNRCGFVHMETVDMAENAIKALNSTPFKGQVIVVEPGRPKDTAKKAKPMHFGDRNRSHGGGSGGSVAGNKRRRRHNRGNPENRRKNEIMLPNNNNGGNQNLNPEEALQSLQLCSALFLGMCKMLKPEEAGSYQQENNINMGSAGALTHEDQQPVNNNNLPGIAKNSQGRRRGRRNNKGGRGSFHAGSMNSPNDIIRNKQQSEINSGGPMRNNANKIQQKNVAIAPYHKDGPRSNFNQNARVQNRGSGFDNQGNFRNKNDDQSKHNDVWQVGSNFSNDRSQFSDNYTGNNMPTSISLGGMNSNNGNYGNNNIAQERYRGNNSANGNNSNGNFAMGNQDRRGFALPERQTIDYNGQQIASQQVNIRGGNQMTGRNFLNTGHSGQNNISLNKNQSSERIFNRRNDNFGAQSMNRMNNPQQNFGFDNQQIERTNTFGNPANGSFNDGGGGYDNFRSNFEGHFADSRNMNNSNSRNFQNDFPPLGSSGIDMMNRNQPRQNMMFTRRFN